MGIWRNLLNEATCIHRRLVSRTNVERCICNMTREDAREFGPRIDDQREGALLHTSIQIRTEIF